MESDCDVSQKDDDPFASVPGALSKFLTGDMSFEEFSKTSLVEELMASDEVGEDDEESGGEDTSAYHDADGRSSPAGDEQSTVTTEQAKSFASEMSSIQTARKRNLMSTSQMTLPASKKRKLPAHLHAVMGEANLRLARGDPTGAQKLCKEVIRQAPQIASPYLTLAMAYEEIGDMDKHYQLSLIAAHLQQKNYDLWMKLAGLAMERENLRDATLCISKAIRLNPYNEELLEQKATLLMQMGEYRRALDCFETIFANTQVKSGPRYLENTKKMARCCHELSLHSRAIKVLAVACNSFQGSPDHEVVNILAELYLFTKQYHQMYELIVKHYCDHSSEQTHRKAAALPTSCSHTTTQRQHKTQQMQNTANNNLSTITRARLPCDPREFTNPTPPLPLTTSNMVESNQSFSINLSSAVEMSMRLDSDPNFINNIQMTSNADKWEGLTLPKEASEQSLRIKDDIPIDLRVKLIVSMIHLGMLPGEDILAPLISEDPEHCGDLYLDIAEAYMENGQPSLALSYLSTLVKTETFNQAGVWLKHADCLHQMGDLEDAANSYAAVLNSVPQHTEARLKLVEVYIALGRSDDALAILDQESREISEEVEVEDEKENDQFEHPNNQFSEQHHSEFTLPHQDIRLSYHKFLLLQGESQLEESLDVSNEMLAYFFRNVIQCNIVLLGEKNKTKKRPANITDEQEKEFKRREKMLSKEEWYTLFNKTCYALFTLQRYAELKNWLIMAINSGRFDKKHKNNLYVMMISTSLIVSDYRNAYQLLKNFYRLYPTNPDILWVLQSRLPNNKFSCRLMMRKLVQDSTNPLILLLNGNYSFTRAQYLPALGLYKELYRLQPTNALACLLIGLCFIGMVGKSKGITFGRYRNALLLQAFAFIFKYARLTGDSQEAYYNLGRAFHHIGLVHIAVNFYKRVLITSPSHSTDLSLSREAAYNLSLIYRDSGNLALARLTLKRYLTV